jgi:UDP-N-acetyl-D-mannosaminuronic acid dehydrogenase
MEKYNVVVLGLGYIGLPTAALLASNGYFVHGVDLNEEVVNIINSGRVHIVEKDLDAVVKRVVKDKKLRASLSVVAADTYVVVVPTPFMSNHSPDISYVQHAIENIGPYLKEGDLVIIESTCPVGTTDKMRVIIEGMRPDLIDKINLAYCPERVLPGNILGELINNDRIVGGINERSTTKAINFYKKIVKGSIHPTDARTAELCKLTENASRDVQIAFANELSMICQEANVDVWELIRLANKHPRVNILQPGCGVGGHCIAVDPYFLVSDFPLHTRLIKQARETNKRKTAWCIEEISKAAIDFKIKNGLCPKIALLGLAFKPNIDDLRESPAVEIAYEIAEKFGDQNLYIVEPNIDEHKVFTLSTLDVALVRSNIIVLLVGHKEFDGVKSERVDLEIINFCGVDFE